MKTKTIEIKPEKVIHGFAEFIISIDMDDVIVTVEATPYLGKRLTYVSVRDKKTCLPKVRVITPQWVWRKIRNMLKTGSSDIQDFIHYTIKTYASLNVTDISLRQPNYERLYFEEPFRLLSLM
jgi:hypothetical protein